MKLFAIAALALAIGLASAAHGQERDHRGPPVLVVTGDGEVSARPDRAVVSLGVTAQAEQAQAAQEQVNATMQKILDAIHQQGVAREMIQTAGLSLHPVYSQPPYDPRTGQQREEPRITGYRASNTVRVILDDLTKIGPVIDAGTTAGANQIQGVSFELKDDTQARSEALVQASERAREKATVLARAMGVSLDSIQEVAEGGVNVIPPQPYAGVRMAAMEASTPVEPGQMRVHASVTLTYRIRQGE